MTITFYKTKGDISKPTLVMTVKKLKNQNTFGEVISVGTNIIQRKDDVYLKFNCNVKIVDMIMGAGKTISAINYINRANPSEKFLFITLNKSLCSLK